MISINEQLRNSIIAHSHYVERFKLMEVKKIQAILKRAENDLKEVLNKYSDIEVWTVAKQKKILAEVEALQKVYSGELQTTLLQDLKEYGGYEASFYAKEIQKVVDSVNFGISVSTITPSKVYAVATNNPIMFTTGQTFVLRTFIKQFNVNNVNYVNQALKQSFLLGETTAQARRKLFSEGGLYLKSYNAASTLVRTSFSHFASQARHLTYNENKDVVKGYQWVSTLDERTSDTCISLDSLYWLYDAPEKSTLPSEITPPAHMNCRSATVPITRSWRELGIDLDEAPEGTRASMNGQVPASISYREWLETQSASMQKDVLGAVRYDMYKKGEIKIDSFYSRDGRMYSLNELKKKDYNISKEYQRYIKGN